MEPPVYQRGVSQHTLPRHASLRRAVSRFVSSKRMLLIAAALVTVGVGGLTTEARSDAAFTFDGGGWGHGVGMSQYGAFGMSRDGASAEEILGHYYRGTTTGLIGRDIPSNGPLWVNLVFEATSVELEPAGGPLDISRGSTSTTATGPTTIEIVPGTGACRVDGEAGLDAGACEFDVSWDGPQTILGIGHVVLRSGSPGGVACAHTDWNAGVVRPCRYGRGSVHIRPDNDSASFHVVLEITLDDYVLGISEMPYVWGERGGYEALEAQAIAARSYAARRQAVKGDPASQRGCWCHVVDTTFDQRYVGWGHSGPGQQRWIDAVRATNSVVAVFPGERVGGRTVPIQAFYSSSSYGKTEPASLGFGTDVPYLVSVDDRWASNSSLGNPQVSWSKTVAANDIQKALDLPAAPVDVSVAACSPSGAAATIAFDLANGETRTFAARRLRTPLGLRSPQILAVSGIGPCTGSPQPTLRVVSVRVDDDGSADSVGNADGIANCGETIELRVEIGSTGQSPARELELVPEDAGVAIVHNRVSPYPAIDDATATNTNDWDILIGPDVSGVVTFRLSGDGGIALPVTLDVACAVGEAGDVTLAGIRVDDDTSGDSVGNGDGRIQCGETVELELGLTATAPLPGGALAANLDVEGATILHNSHSEYPPIGPDPAYNTNDFDLVIAGSQPVTITLTVVANGVSHTVSAELPVDCGTVDLAVSEVVIDDGERGDSRGDNDGAAECGETVEIYVRLEGAGSVRARTGTARIRGDGSLLHNSESPFSARHGVVENTNDWDVLISETARSGSTLLLDLSVELDDGTWQDTVEISIGCRSVTVTELTVDDGVRGDSRGDLDRLAECGETIELYATISNQSADLLRDITIRIIEIDRALTPLYNRSSRVPDVKPGEHGENVDDFDLAVSSGLSSTVDARIVFEVTAGGLRWELPATVSLACPRGGGG